MEQKISSLRSQCFADGGRGACIQCQEKGGGPCADGHRKMATPRA
jgi:hypothetical protein